MLAITRFRRAKRKAEEGEEVDSPTLRERGAAALEFALVAPLFFLVVFSGIEVGYMFRSHLTLEDTTRTAARVASVERNNANADLAILTRINARVGELNGDVTRVVIFMGDTLGSEVPVACTTTAALDLAGERCNIYPVIDGDMQFVVDNWTARNGIAAAERQALDNIGIYIEYDYNYVTGFFDTLTLSSTTVEVIELDL